ncbi:MAG: lamin tail domain-containing protein [Bacteroidia bacterium]|nr:lamin tail domain-containing protein [Bacteroidia bacterium]
MKKLYIFIIIMVMAGFVSAQDCSDLFISEYVEGWNNNKALEIYNPTPNIITFTDNYRVIRWSNGSTIADLDIQYVLPLVGDIQPYQTVVIIQDTNFPGQDTMVWAGLRAKADYLAPADYTAGTQGCRVIFWNGDDAVSLQKFTGGNWVDIDIFAEIGVRPLNWQGATTPAGAWTDTPPYWRGEGAYLTQNQSLIRKPAIKHGIDRATMNTYGNTVTGGFPDSFNAFVEYDSMPANFFDSLGFHTCECKSLSINERQNPDLVQLFPNPVTGNQVTLRALEPIESIELYNMLGERIYMMKVIANSREVVLDINANMHNSILMVQVKTRNNRVSIQKMVVR